MNAEQRLIAQIALICAGFVLDLLFWAFGFSAGLEMTRTGIASLEMFFGYADIGLISGLFEALPLVAVVTIAIDYFNFTFRRIIIVAIALAPLCLIAGYLINILDPSVPRRF